MKAEWVCGDEIEDQYGSKSFVNMSYIVCRACFPFRKWERAGDLMPKANSRLKSMNYDE